MKYFNNQVVISNKLYNTLIILSLSIWIGNAAAALTFTNGQAADLVLGQSSFTTGTIGCSATSLNTPAGVAIDPVTNKVFVSDYSNNRVLRFASVSSLANGAAAEAALGQPNLTTCLAGATATGMYGPTGISIDSSGRLWVADYRNNRVLRFDGAATKASGANADGVLGQTSFTTSAPATTQTGMWAPYGIFADGTRVWVGDVNNARVLRFDNAASKSNGANADGVLGQTLFTTRTIAITQSGMDSPNGIFVDNSGRLWVTDFGSHRVSRFDGAASKSNGANADVVLGQSNFTSSTFATTAAGMNNPDAVVGDSFGDLYVHDSSNHRVLIFTNAASKTNGGSADYVLGQASLTTGTSGTTATTLKSGGYLSSLAWHGATNSLWVPDDLNHRVLRYTFTGAAQAPISAPIDFSFNHKPVETTPTEIELK